MNDVCIIQGKLNADHAKNWMHDLGMLMPGNLIWIVLPPPLFFKPKLNFSFCSACRNMLVIYRVVQKNSNIGRMLKVNLKSIMNCLCRLNFCILCRLNTRTHKKIRLLFRLLTVITEVCFSNVMPLPIVSIVVLLFA